MTERLHSSLQTFLKKNKTVVSLRNNCPIWPEMWAQSYRLEFIHITSNNGKLRGSLAKKNLIKAYFLDHKRKTCPTFFILHAFLAYFN